MIGVLASYALESAGRSGERAEPLIAAGVPFVWDSGAFSVLTGAAQVSVEGHTEWVLSQPDRDHVRFVGLDVIGDADATFENYRMQREAGAAVEPTLHYGTSLDYLDRLLDVAPTEWVNVGGIVSALGKPSQHRNVAAFIAAVRRRVPDGVKLHALGCVHPGIARMVPFEAADSTYWMNVVRFRSLSLFDRRLGDWKKFPACSTTADNRRLDTWRRAFTDGSWLRAEYGIDPTDVALDANDDLLVAAAIESYSRFADYYSAFHGGSPVTLYLAGAVNNPKATDWVLGYLRQRATL